VTGFSRIALIGFGEVGQTLGAMLDAIRRDIDKRAKAAE
jgi:hypothetical protein